MISRKLFLSIAITMFLVTVLLIGVRPPERRFVKHDETRLMKHNETRLVKQGETRSAKQDESRLVEGRVMSRKVHHFLKEAGYGIGNMQTPLFWDDIDEQRGLLVVDVGACDGSDWTVPAVIQRGHTVLAFEPVNTERFMNKIRASGLESKTVLVDSNKTSSPEKWPLEGQIFLFAAGASDYDGTVQIHSDNELASVIPQDFYGRSDSTTGRSVPVLRLDSVIHNQDIHILKIDTQGSELPVLRGAEALFRGGHINMVELEFWPKGMIKGGHDPVEVLNFLHKYGFMCFDYSRNKHIPPDRPSDFEGFVASFDGDLSGGFGAWDELICFNTLDKVPAV